MLTALTLILFYGCSDKSPTPTITKVEAKKTRPAGHPAMPNAAKDAKSKMRSQSNVAPPTAGSIEKASGGTVLDIYTHMDHLKNKKVSVRGKVMKFSPNIMGKNWVHLQDGSGDKTKGTHDLTITTQKKVTVGEVVRLTGTLITDKDFGAGYFYKVMIENAVIE